MTDNFFKYYFLSKAIMIASMWIGTGIGVAFVEGEAAVAFFITGVLTFFVLVWATDTNVNLK
jgi:hypothetical protein